MNLIEQLGGYELAKSKCDRANKEGYLLLSVPVQNGFGDIYVYKVEAALLEYRRQHKIFEEKDNIVFVDEFMHGELMTVAWVRNGEVWMDDGAKRCTDLTMIRHATDAEIEARKRLEVV